MKELEEQFRILFEQASDGIFVADSIGNLIDVNEVGCKMLEYSIDELKSMSVPDILLPDEIERYHACVERLLKGEGKRERGKVSGLCVKTVLFLLARFQAQNFLTVACRPSYET